MKIGGLIILTTFVMLLLFQNQANTASQTAEAFASSTSSTFTDLNIMSIATTDYIVRNQENRRISEALSYGCAYGKEDKFRHLISSTVPIQYSPEKYVENFYNQTITGEYYFKMDCNLTDPDSKVVKAGVKPPETGDIIVRSIPIPLPRKGMTTAKLYRWYQ